MNYTVLYNDIKAKILSANIYPKPFNSFQTMEYVSLTFEEEGTLLVKSEKKINSVVVRPLSLGITPNIINDEIHIKISKPVKFSLEINQETENNLLVIIHPKHDYKISKEDADVIYISSGVHDMGIINVENDDTTIYFEEGAYVHGKIHGENCSNLKICGNGILSMEKISRDTEEKYMRCVDVRHCKNVSISDIIIHDSVNWSLRILGCDNCHINNVSIIGSRGNSDGIDICGSRNVVVEDCFLRVWDDSLVVKAFDTGDVENIVFRKCILWNDFARPIEVGVELRAEHVRNILFSDIDVIHSLAGYPVMGIHHGDRAVVSDITFENIRIEDAPGAQIFDIRITDSVWNRDIKKGRIHDIIFKNIDLTGQPGVTCLPEKSRIQGFSDEHNIENITFENIRLLGKTATTIEACNLNIFDYVKNVQIKYDENAEPIKILKSGLNIIKPFKLNNDGMNYGTVEISITNDNNTVQTGCVWLNIFPRNTASYNDKKFTCTLKPYETVAMTYDVVLPPGKYGMSVGANDVNITSSWLFLPFSWELNEDIPIEKLPMYSFINYYNDHIQGICATVNGDNLIIKSPLLNRKGEGLVLYTAVPVEQQIGEVKFTVEETDFGEAMALIVGKDQLELAPQLRCPAEITYVFNNAPKVEKIVCNKFSDVGADVISIPFENLGLPKGTKHFWIEVEAKTPQVSKYRYPFTLFHSVVPETMAHMFADVIIV